jgi:release factor glutamine methyltransferase
MSLYQPREDSFLLKKHLKDNIQKSDSVLDMGAGTGILAKEAQKYAKEVLAADIDRKAVIHCTQQGILSIQSSLFEKITGKFDVIIFNPPYLPEDRNEPKSSSVQTTGGKEGYEMIKLFLEKAKSHLKPDGRILLLFSSLTKKEKVNTILKHLNYSFTILETKPLFFEKLYVYLITANQN